MPRTNFPGLKQSGADSPQQLALIVNDLRLGKTNNTLDVTLRASQVTTTIDDPRFYSTSALVFCPTTANGSAHPMTYFTVSKGRAVLHHDNNAAVDKTGVLVIIA